MSEPFAPALASITEAPPLIPTAQIDAAVAILKRGGLVAFPTETVYGLGANAESVEALDRLYTVKGRPKGHPVIVHLANLNQLTEWAEAIPDAAWRLAEAFWPGPLTLILNRTARVPDAVTGGQDTVGIRIPDHPVALQLLQAFGGGVAAPSANRFGRLSPTSAAHVQVDLGGDVDLILDGGDCRVGVESTIVAFREGLPVILRPGMITAEQIEAALAAESASPPSASPVPGRGNLSPKPSPHSGSNLLNNTVSRAPGTLASHYAPRTPLRLFSMKDIVAQLAQLEVSEVASFKPMGVLARQPQPPEFETGLHGVWIELADEPEAYARQLYAQLRALDQRQLSEIWVESVPDCGAWAAVADRLRRAAHQG